ncbi:tetratricopeptide repeat protein [uncultured Dokdonia sp.]|uniref:tetratricopeptide repeat protein n=1 Tax=uncultured Dokdonia sp. TaxID=575653 RepID=UPI00260D591E|nr:tetratricopeptide repeat protein [uncultured Dokdonia sp.]
MKWLLILLFPICSFAQGNAVDPAFAKAENYFYIKQYNQAKPIFKSYLKQHPNDLKTLEYLGDIYGFTQEWDTAIDYYKKLVELSPKVANYHYKYGGVLGMKALAINKVRALGLIGDIKEAFITAATLDPKHVEARWALVEFYIQLPGVIGGSESKAKQYANELATLSPVDGHLAHGYIAEYNHKPKDAEYHYKKAVAIGGSVICYTKLYEHYEKNKAPEKAMQVLDEAQKKHTSENRLHYQLGKIAGQYGIGLDQGIECLDKYIMNYSSADGVPKDWAYYRLAQIYKHKGQKEEAKTWISKALQNRPDFKEALVEKKLIEAL